MEEKKSCTGKNSLKNKKNRNLLSFQEDILVTMPKGQKVQSSHDVLNDKRLKRQVIETDEMKKKLKSGNNIEIRREETVHNRLTVDTAETK